MKQIIDLDPPPKQFLCFWVSCTISFRNWKRFQNYFPGNKQRTVEKHKKEDKGKKGYGVLECLSLTLTAKGSELRIDSTTLRSPDLAAPWRSCPLLGFWGFPIVTLLSDVSYRPELLNETWAGPTIRHGCWGPTKMPK